ncbi:MAG: M20/M25/M40 family metallo-hydrolase [Pseudomonadota bacterium]|nr:M20/M25/M40 family metallo-hydrolase [Pseudomonadota bacterium]
MNGIDKVLQAVDGGLDQSVERLFTLLRIPSVSTDPAYTTDCLRAAEHTADLLRELGFDASVRSTPGLPMVVGHYRPDNGMADGPHVLFYGHYDVQPPDPLELWEAPPFEPRIAEIEPGRRVIVARGACDDKGQFMTFLEACRAWKAATGRLPLRITVLIEGEEESGSPSIKPFFDANRDELKADVALVCDTGQWDHSTPAVTTMLRGLVLEEVTVTAANRDLHSGLFGGAAMNPIRALAKVVADLHGPDGRVQIPGFYDGVEELPPDIKAQWESLNLTAAEFLGQVGLSEPAGEAGRSVVEQVWARPTCDVNGMWGGYTGQGSKTVIPSQAHAKVSFRLVGKQDPHKIQAAFRNFVRARLPKDCKAEFKSHGASPALALDPSSPYLAKAREALASEWGKPALVIGSGGSIPIVGAFKRDLGMDALMIGYALDDDRVHSPNEKYDLSSFHKGIRSWARVIAALAS